MELVLLIRFILSEEILTGSPSCFSMPFLPAPNSAANTPSINSPSPRHTMVTILRATWHTANRKIPNPYEQSIIHWLVALSISSVAVSNWKGYLANVTRICFESLPLG